MSCRYTAQGEFLCQNPTQNNNNTIIEHFGLNPPRDSYGSTCRNCQTMTRSTGGITDLLCGSCQKKNGTWKQNPGKFNDIEGCHAKINKTKTGYKSIINDDGRLSCP